MHDQRKVQTIICLAMVACFLLSLAGLWVMIKATGGQVWTLNYIAPIFFEGFVSLIACLLMRFVIRKLSAVVFLVALVATFTIAAGYVFVGLMSFGWIAN
jgi:hypothetical protein